MYTVINPQNTILVDYRDNQFVVEDLSSHETRCLPEKDFYGYTFKYECDFFSKFFTCFDGKEFIILTKNAEYHYLRVKNSNREGIF